MSWNGMCRKLEQEYLAECLRGRIQYFATTYRDSHDREGRAAIRLDGEEILKGNYFNNYLYWKQFWPRYGDGYDCVDAQTLDCGAFDQRSLYKAFEAFDNQSIDQSLQSDDLLVRIFALLDRRVGKRRLIAMRDEMKSAPEVLRKFYDIRMDAEGLADESGTPA